MRFININVFQNKSFLKIFGIFVEKCEMIDLTLSGFFSMFLKKVSKDFGENWKT